MKSVFLVCLGMLLLPLTVEAARLNMTPYFGLGTATMRADLAGQTSNAPTGYVVMGTSLPWVYSNFAAEFRFGLGGQLGTYNGKVSTFSSYLLKPGLSLTQNWDIYGLLGFGTMNVTVAGVRSSDTDLNYGVGLKYYIPNESLTLSGELMRYHTSTNASTNSISGMDISGASITLSFDYY